MFGQVTAIGKAVTRVKPGDFAVVDGLAGTVVLNPSPQTLMTARKAVTAFARERQRYSRLRRLPALLPDEGGALPARRTGPFPRTAAEAPGRLPCYPPPHLIRNLREIGRELGRRSVYSPRNPTADIGPTDSGFRISGTLLEDRRRS